MNRSSPSVFEQLIFDTTYVIQFTEALKLVLIKSQYHGIMIDFTIGIKRAV